MTTTCKRRHPHLRAQAERPLAQASRLTKVCGPARSAPSQFVTVRR